MNSSVTVTEALRSAQAAWVGCDWDTEFGSRKSNLRGLRSRQAKLAAQATGGEESAYWVDVCRFLEGIERDARCASELAADAVTRWTSGDLAAALTQIDRAIALEARYRPPQAYPALRQLIQSDQASACS